MRIQQPLFLVPLPPTSRLIAFASSDFKGKGPMAPGSTNEGGGGGVAPGKSTLTSRLPGRPEAPSEPVSSPLAGPLARHPDRPNSPTDDPFALHLESSAAQPVPQVAVSPADVRLAGPPSVDFGEVVVGEVYKRDVHVYNVHPTGIAYVNALLVGSHEIQLNHPTPERLRPSADEPGIPFPLVYQPDKPGKSQATLSVVATWASYTGWAPKTLEIPVRGVAYVYGEDPPSVLEARRAQEEEKANQAKADREWAAKVIAEIDADNKIDTPYPQGPLNKLDNAFLRAHDALDLLGERREIGIGVAAAEAEAFHRRIPNASPDLLLAMVVHGLMIYGLSGQAAQLVKALLSGSSATKAVAPLVGEMIKGGIRNLAKSKYEALPGAAASPEEDADEPRILFFALQRNALANSKDERRETLRHILARLRPLLRGKHPEEAAEAMSAVADGLERTATAAIREQADASRIAWMRFLAQTELGSMTPEQVDLKSALDLPMESQAYPRYDGVLDLEVTLDHFNPLETMKISEARMNGVMPAMAESLVGIPLGELLQRGVVIRVHFKDPHLAVMSVVLVCDGDRIEWRDETSPAGEESRWLSRAGGYIGPPSPERQKRGAAALKDLLMKQTLEEMGIQVVTDHVPRKRGER